MKYMDFVNWVDVNCPEGVDPEDMVEFLASRAAMIVDEGAKSRGVSPKEFLSGFLAGSYEEFIH